MKDTPLYLSDEVTDTQRNQAVTVVAPTIKPQFTVFVEGSASVNPKKKKISLDLLIIKNLCPNILVQAAGSKSMVVEKVKENTNVIGIVDMDSDFNGEMIRNISRLIDTNPYSCLFAQISDFFPVSNFYNFVQAKVSGKYAEFRIIQPNFEENISEVNKIIKSKTNTSLYGGFIAHESRKLLLDYFVIPTWDMIFNQQEIYSNGIYNWYEDKNDYNNAMKFVTEFKSILDKSGINDHAVEETIQGLVNSEFSKRISDSGIEKGRIGNTTIKRHFMQFIKSQVLLKESSIFQSLANLKQFIEKHQLEFERQKKQV